jgi:hypothetical protein
MIACSKYFLGGSCFVMRLVREDREPADLSFTILLKIHRRFIADSSDIHRRLLSWSGHEPGRRNKAVLSRGQDALLQLRNLHDWLEDE